MQLSSGIGGPATANGFGEERCDISRLRGCIAPIMAPMLLRLGSFPCTEGDEEVSVGP